MPICIAFGSLRDAKQHLEHLSPAKWCPVYRNVGGHTYGTTYQGPIGSVLTPHLRGREFEHLSYASSLCGACTSVCPLKIDLRDQRIEPDC